MPLYDFECEDCGYIEEILTSSAGATEIVLTCPNCEKEIMKRKIGLSSFQLKGGGWYETDFKTGSKKNVAEGTSSSSSSSSASSSGESGGSNKSSSSDSSKSKSTSASN